MAPTDNNAGETGKMVSLCKCRKKVLHTAMETRENRIQANEKSGGDGSLEVCGTRDGPCERNGS